MIAPISYKYKEVKCSERYLAYVCVVKPDYEARPKVKTSAACLGSELTYAGKLLVVTLCVFKAELELLLFSQCISIYLEA